MTTKLTISQAIEQMHLPVFDVRSPGEFEQAHIPNAISLPLFSDEERKIVGTLYKQQGKQIAIKKGLQIFGGKMTSIVEIVEKHLSEAPNKKTIVHCWRGGMRSAGIAWLLDLYGFEVQTIVGGYKAFRRWVLQQLAGNYQFELIGGYTGSGKTFVLNHLRATKNIIDLEALANHQGSAFGGIGKGLQPRQEMFENLLALELYKKDSAKILVEDESQRVGDLIIPKNIWEQMRKSKILFFDLPFEVRLQNILNDYGNCSVEKLMEATKRIEKRLGPNETKQTLALLHQGEIRKAFEILLRYYDKQYSKSLLNRNDAAQQIETIVANNEKEIIQHFENKIK